MTLTVTFMLKIAIFPVKFVMPGAFVLHKLILFSLQELPYRYEEIDVADTNKKIGIK